MPTRYLSSRWTRGLPGTLCMLCLGSFGLYVAGAQQRRSADVARTPVLQLGRFDGASSEFASGSPTGPVHVNADAPDVARSWYAFQAETSASAGADAAPRSLRVVLAKQPAASYTMRVSLLIEHASVPALHMTINGHEGTFYLNPKLDRNVGDGGAVSFPSYSRAQVCFAVPGTFLHEGQNELSFSAVPAAEGAQLADAGFNYDAIALTEGTDGACDPAESEAARVLPTIFYKTVGGELKEGVDVRLRYGKEPIRAAVMESRGQTYNLNADEKASWGEAQTRVYLPVFEPRSKVQIKVRRGEKAEVVQRLIDPQKRWTVYVVPHVHLDLGYTDYQAKVASVQSRVIDEALDLIDVHPEFASAWMACGALSSFWRREHRRMQPGRSLR